MGDEWWVLRWIRPRHISGYVLFTAMWSLDIGRRQGDGLHALRSSINRREPTWRPWKSRSQLSTLIRNYGDVFPALAS
jgi:hypothetical protein